MDISIIIINFNTKELTCRCVESFIKNRNDTLNSEIIIIDNASTDGSGEYFKEKFFHFNNVRVIVNEKNHGFGIANNIGANLAVSKYIAFVNSDTYVEKIDFSNLISCFEENENIGALSCKILYPDATVQSLGFDFPSMWNDFKLNFLFWNYKYFKNYRYKNYRNKGMKKRDWVSGCFFMCRRDLFQEVGGFDSNIFMYAEDLDICARFSANGNENYVYDKEEIYHLHGQSSKHKKVDFQKMLSSKKNYLYVIKKNKLSKSALPIYCMHWLHVFGIFCVKRVKEIIHN